MHKPHSCLVFVILTDKEGLNSTDTCPTSVRHANKFASSSLPPPAWINLQQRLLYRELLRAVLAPKEQTFIMPDSTSRETADANSCGALAYECLWEHRILMSIILAGRFLASTRTLPFAMAELDAFATSVPCSTVVQRVDVTLMQVFGLVGQVVSPKENKTLHIVVFVIVCL